MTDDVWALLASGNSNERLKGARRLARIARRADRERIAAALAAEDVVWVRKALEAAMLRASDGKQPTPVETDSLEEFEPDDAVYATVWGEAAGSLLHEVNPILGLLRVNAPREIRDYEASRCKLHIDRLAAVLQAISDLGRASAVPRLGEFDLAVCLRAAEESLREHHTLEVEFNGPEPCFVHGDSALIDLSVMNAMRNAIESQRAAKVGTPIVVAWGDTDCDYWITVLDRGVGLPAGFKHAFDVGRTSKKAHAGMGLAIARRAARSLRGSAALRPRANGGAAFELRWPRLERHSG